MREVEKEEWRKVKLGDLGQFLNGVNFSKEKKGSEIRLINVKDILDLLYKPDLTANEKKQVKLVAKRLLAVLKKEKLVLDWRKRQQTRADVVLTIRNILDDGLPRSYTPAVYQQKCGLVYHHVYDAYYGSERSVYAAGV